ncbi:MAG: AAA family ATPase [Chlamydiia bacterium]|nr:AAA family ATPase [Chlamydiia bacterium]
MAHKQRETFEKIIGRSAEQKILNHVLRSKKAEFLALYGRRRVGKTFLIRNFFIRSADIFFHATGIQNGKMQQQLKQFAIQIGTTFYNGVEVAPSQNWFDAFENLTKAIVQIKPSKQIVVFLDELPWMATRRSNLLQALEYYWNRYWNHDTRLKLVVCGSSASWIIDKIINSKGGLYNRVTRRMNLAPFSLCETKAFLHSINIRLNNRQILDFYLALGGIPHYLALCQQGMSAIQNISDLCFRKNGALVDEFPKLFASLFSESDIYVELIRIIAQSHTGVDQAQIVRKSGATKGGRIIQKLKQLEDAGFTTSFLPHGHQQKGIYYKVIDEYTLFYIHWIEPYLQSSRRRDQSEDYWSVKAQTSSWKSWSGLAFEAVCYKHIAQIRKAIQIDAGAEIGSWRYVPKIKEHKKGAQIDLLFDRNDDVITLCEIKHSDKPFVIDKEYANNLKTKMEIYKKQTHTHKDLFLAMITSNGLKQNQYSKKLISQQADLEDLFKF